MKESRSFGRSVHPTALAMALGYIAMGAIVRMSYPEGAGTRGFAAHSEGEHQQQAWTKLVRRGRVVGDHASRHRVTVYLGYYEIPSSALMKSIEDIAAQYWDRIAIGFRHLPDYQRLYSIRASCASECAGRNGALLKMIRTLQDKQPILWGDRIDLALREAVIDHAVLEGCTREACASAIRADAFEARRANINVAPSVVVDDQAVPLDSLRQYVESLLTSK